MEILSITSLTANKPSRQRHFIPSLPVTAWSWSKIGFFISPQCYPPPHPPSHPRHPISASPGCLTHNITMQPASALHRAMITGWHLHSTVIRTFTVKQMLCVFLHECEQLASFLRARSTQAHTNTHQYLERLNFHSFSYFQRYGLLRRSGFRSRLMFYGAPVLQPSSASCQILKGCMEKCESSSEKSAVCVAEASMLECNKHIHIQYVCVFHSFSTGTHGFSNYLQFSHSIIILNLSVKTYLHSHGI